MSIIDEIRNDVAGAELLADWLGHGGEPASSITAEHRASACTFGDGGFPCPLNVDPNWWNRIKSAIARAIQSEIELKHKLALKVSVESSLHMCAACGCCLPLKVWVPVQHLKAHVPEHALRKTPLYCWMRKELPPL